jgi:hypothetical protein
MNPRVVPQLELRVMTNAPIQDRSLAGYIFIGKGKVLDGQKENPLYHTS